MVFEGRMREILSVVLLLASAGVVFFQSCSDQKVSNDSVEQSSECGGGACVSLPEFETENREQERLENEDLSPIDLRDYFPRQKVTTKLRKATGNLHASFTYLPAPEHFIEHYKMRFDLQKSGELFIWAKAYPTANCTTTYAHLFFGDDRSVTEVGGYHVRKGEDRCSPDAKRFSLGYMNHLNSVADGLAWAAEGGLKQPGGFGKIASKFNLRILSDWTPDSPYVDHGATAWNYTGLVKVLPTFQPTYGRSPEGIWGEGLGKTYSDVLRVILWHGTRSPKHIQLPKCTMDAQWDPTWPYARFYLSLETYHTYASEFYIAKGKWIIQQTLLYIEDASYWPSLQNCDGYSIDKDPKWVTYIDDP